ncbi:MAG: NAD(P)H-hydrate epimerase, partial [Armatimonadetes bacterium 13_1_40CM_3_65_7]
MAALERRCHEAHGISVHALMEQAGLRTAEVARLLQGQGGRRRVAVLVGKGNNGGDGLVAARHLAGDGPTRVLLVVPRGELRGLPADHLKTLGDRRVRIDDAQPLSGESLREALRDADLIVDAIFGTGFRGPAEGLPARVIEAANASGVPILAVDVPSGVDASGGRADPPCVHALATVAMGLPKVG